jgi:dTDP-glucose 4,6-dehydratase
LPSSIVVAQQPGGRAGADLDRVRRRLADAQLLYVDDLIRGLVLLAESDIHEPVNLGNPDEMTLLDLAKAIIELTESRSEIVFEALPIDDPQARQSDITRARQLPGWEPEVDIREGLRHTIEHYARVLGNPAER